MDGVIVDSEPIHHLAYQQHFAELDINVSPEMYSTFTGNSTKNIYQRLIKHFELNGNAEDYVLRKRNLFDVAFDADENLSLLPGVEDLIKELHTNGVQLILASSSAHVTINKIFAKFNLSPYFSHIVSGEDFPNSKPDPAIFNKAAELSGHDKSSCIVIEDSTNGIKAANAAGIFCVGYNGQNANNQDYSTADLVIYDFLELSVEKIQSL